MQYLKDNKVQHRDLKASNCLLEYESGQFRVKLTDFGLSKSKTLVTTFSGRSSGGGPSGTVTHMAPEVMSKNVFTEKSDVYSFGIVIWEVLSRAVPFEGLQQPQIFARVPKGERPSPIPENSPSGLVTLMEACWASEPFVRPDFKRIVGKLRQLGQ